MRHTWEYHNDLKALGSFGLRTCKTCRKAQRKEVKHSWGRMTGHTWEPLAGRCKGVQK